MFSSPLPRPTSWCVEGCKAAESGQGGVCFSWQDLASLSAASRRTADGQGARLLKAELARWPVQSRLPCPPLRSIVCFGDDVAGWRLPWRKDGPSGGALRDLINCLEALSLPLLGPRRAFPARKARPPLLWTLPEAIPRSSPGSRLGSVGKGALAALHSVAHRRFACLWTAASRVNDWTSKRLAS